jgi:regulatory protein YycI of two-component signal transduction system YycFG
MVERPGKSPALDEKKVLDIANRFLRENIGLKPEEFNYVKTQYLHNAVQGPDGKPVETIDEAIAVFGRTIDKIEIVGYGGFVKVHFDNEGKVTGYQKEWRNWQPHKKSQRIKPYAAAKEEFMKLMQTRLKSGGYARVNSVTFGYFERGFLEEQKYLQPAYVFNTVYYDKETNQSVAARLEVIPAISELLEPLIVDQDLSSRDDKRPEKP